MIEYESPQRSVRHALTELQLKTKLLEEERDYFVHLQMTTARAFADHRNELQGLLQKEQQYAAAQEERMQAHLQRLTSENALIETQHSEARRHSNSRLHQAVEDFQGECQLREKRLTAEVTTVHDELRRAHDRATEALAALEVLRLDVDDLKRRQALLQGEVQQLTGDNQRLADEADFQARARLHSSSAVRAAAAARVSSRPRALQEPLKPFIPSGKASHEHMGVPSTANVNAVVQTIRSANIRSPMRSHSQPQHRSGHHLDGICRSLIAELLELRAEYDAICRAMSLPEADSLGLSTRLRQVFAAMDQKMLQLRQLRKSQHKLDDEERLNGLLAEVARENNHCTRTLTELVSVIRHPA